MFNFVGKYLIIVLMNREIIFNSIVIIIKNAYLISNSIIIT